MPMHSFDTVLVLAPSLQPIALADDRLLLLGEREHRILSGRALTVVGLALDGTRTKGDILLTAAAEVGEFEAVAAMRHLESAGYAVEREHDAPDEALAFWHSAGAPIPAAIRRLKTARVTVRALGDGTSDSVDEVLLSLAAAGLEARRVDPHDNPSHGTCASAVDVWVVDDYDRDELSHVNRMHLEARAPLPPAQGDGHSPMWAVISADASTGFAGPLFGTPESACWTCLVHAMRRNRPLHRWMRTHGVGLPRAQKAALSASRRALASLFAIAIAQTIANPDRRSPLANRLLALDACGLDLSSQHVLRRPQCPACGDPGLMRARASEPIALRAAPKRRPHEAGYRQRTSTEMAEQLRRLVSKHVGAVAFAHPMPGRESPLHEVWVSGYFIAPPSRDRIDDCVRICAGKGKTSEQAYTSAVCEAVERCSGQYEGDELRIRASRRELGEDAIAPELLLGFSARQYARRDSLNAAASHRAERVAEPLDDSTAIDWTTVWSLRCPSRRLVPFTYCYAGAPEESGGRYCPTNGNGVAAGSSIEEAVLQALLELIERDAVAVWWYNRLSRPAVEWSLVEADPYLVELVADYSRRGARVALLDLTHDLGIPVHAAVARYSGRSAPRFAVGFGCHLRREIAARRAFTELNQLGDGVHPGSGRPLLDTARLPDLGFLAPDPQALAPPDAPAIVVDGSDLRQDIHEVLNRLDGAGLEAFAVDKTRPDLGVSVAQVIVPGLRHFWPRFGPGRLYDVPVRLGWRSTPLDERELNPAGLVL